MQTQVLSLEVPISRRTVLGPWKLNWAKNGTPGAGAMGAEMCVCYGDAYGGCEGYVVSSNEMWLFVRMERKLGDEKITSKPYKLKDLTVRRSRHFSAYAAGGYR